MNDPIAQDKLIESITKQQEEFKTRMNMYSSSSDDFNIVYIIATMAIDMRQNCNKILESVKKYLKFIIKTRFIFNTDSVSQTPGFIPLRINHEIARINPIQALTDGPYIKLKDVKDFFSIPFGIRNNETWDDKKKITTTR